MIFTKSALLTLHLLLCFTLISCKGEQQKVKEALIQQTVSQLKAETQSTPQQPSNLKQLDSETKTINEKSTLQTANTKPANTEVDKIIGVWEVNNAYYKAVYEIEKYQGNYVGKIHYYNDGQTEYTGKNTEADYFLEGVTFENGAYKNGKMYMPNGSYYYVLFTLNGDELSVKMTVEGEPYTEVWKRKKAE